MAAPETGQSGPSVHLVHELERAAPPRGIHIVAKRRSAGLDREQKGSPDVPRKSCRGHRTEAVRPHAWMETGRKEGFVGVDVSDPRDRGLVEQKGLQRSSRILRRREDGPDQIGLVALDGIDTETAPEPRLEILPRKEGRKASESPWIPELESAGRTGPIAHPPPGMHMIRRRHPFADRRPSQLTAHPELDDQAMSTLDDDRELLPPPIERHDRRSAEQPPGDIVAACRPSSHDVGAQQVDPVDARPHEAIRKRATQMFDFGKFRHARPSARAWSGGRGSILRKDAE